MMKRRPTLKWLLVAVMTFWVVMGCNATPSAPSTVSLTVSAAASLQAVLDAIAPQFHSDHPDIAVTFNFASSGALQQQIEQGAPADVFFSAAAQQMDDLEDQALIQPETRQDLVANRLVLIGARDSALQIQKLEQLKDLEFEHLAVGEFRTVPAGQYAQQALDQADLLTPLQPKFVFGKTVRTVLGAVETGNAELGLVYATDAALSERIQVLLTVPEERHPPIRYPIAVIQASEHPDAAQAWIAFLQSDEAAATFAEFGFEPL